MACCVLIPGGFRTLTGEHNEDEDVARSLRVENSKTSTARRTSWSRRCRRWRRQLPLLEVKEAFENHLEETKGQVERLERISRMKSPKGKKCKAMEGLVEEGKEMLEEDAEPTVKDAGIIAAASASSITRSPAMALFEHSRRCWLRQKAAKLLSRYTGRGRRCR